MARKKQLEELLRERLDLVRDRRVFGERDQWREVRSGVISRTLARTDSKSNAVHMALEDLFERETDERAERLREASELESRARAIRPWREKKLVWPFSLAPELAKRTDIGLIKLRHFWRLAMDRVLCVVSRAGYQRRVRADTARIVADLMHKAESDPASKRALGELSVLAFETTEGIDAVERRIVLQCLYQLRKAKQAPNPRTKLEIVDDRNVGSLFASVFLASKSLTDNFDVVARQKAASVGESGSSRFKGRLEAKRVSQALGNPKAVTPVS